MATHSRVVLIDDLDGISEGAETIDFGLDGNAYQMELTEEHAAELREFMQRYIGVARKVPGGKRASQQRRPRPDGGRAASTLHAPRPTTPAVPQAREPEPDTGRDAAPVEDNLINRTAGRVAIASRRLTSADIDPEQKKKMREWGNKKAEENPSKYGHLRSGVKGRLKQELIDAWQDAH